MPPRRPFAACLLALALAACGGGDGGRESPSASCSLPDQQGWLAGYMNDWYFWYASEPRPDPAGFASIGDYFDALLYPGGAPPFPDKDRWSFSQTTASFDQFFGDGQSLGYGISVAGLEVAEQPAAPLRVRYVEPASPAAGKIARGETIVSINGTTSSQMIASGDFSLLTPSKAGDTIDVLARNAAGAERHVSIVAALFTLTPVSTSAVLATPNGTKVGYVVLKDFISQASAPLDAAFAQFKAANVHELVLDLRYNGGGLVSVADDLASYAVVPSAVGQPFAALTYNDKHQDSNGVWRFGAKASALGVARVYVLTGQRTCSASELVVNGLKPFATVVQVGDTTCGKPFGFNPQDNCGTTFSAVEFESRNAAGVGRYFDGLTPNCPAADDLDHALGDPAERLTATALAHVDSGSCPASAARDAPLSLRRARPPLSLERGEWRGMVDR